MNNREAATFILFAVVVLVALTRAGGRSALAGIAKAFATWRVWVSFAMLALNVVVAVWLAHLVGLWTSQLVGSTVLWFALVGFGWLLNLGDASKPGFISRKVREAIGLGAVLEAFMNLESFSVPIEIGLQIVVLAVVLMHFATATNEQTRPVSSCLDVLLGVGAVCLAAYTLVSLVNDWGNVDKSDLRNEFLFPVWLTVSVVPYIYLLAFVSTWQGLSRLMRRYNDDKRPGVRVLAGAFSELRGSLVDAGSFRHPYVRDAARAGTFRGARLEVKRFRADRAADQEARAAARDILEANTGLKGLGPDGRTLDRREFAATKEALQSLLYRHMGWYRQEGRPDAYRGDLLDMLVSVDAGMSFEPPFITKVRNDGQAWYAYRVTPSGIVLGAGADGPPPASWYYTGTKRPLGYPPGPGWTSFMEETPIEWLEEPEI